MAYTVTFAPLPTNFRGTPQELLEAFLDRMEITSDVVGFVTSDSAPTANDGVWLKNGQQIWVWDEEVEGGTYVPLDVSASTRNEIWIGPGTLDPVTPDTSLYSIWLKIVDSAVEGLFYWNGTAWVSQPVVIGAGAITTDMLADNSVTTNKIKNGAVTNIKLAGNIPMSKWEKGPANYYVRMSTGGTEAQWRAADELDAFIEESELIDITPYTGGVVGDYYPALSVAHTLGVTPKYVQFVIRCKTAEKGYLVGDEVSIPLQTWSNATELKVFIPENYTFPIVYDSNLGAGEKWDATGITLSKWEGKFYYAKGIA
jgi:hypothetical protein